MAIKAFEVTVLKPDGQKVYQVVKPGDKISVTDSVEFDYSILRLLNRKGQNKLKRIFLVKFRRLT